MGALFDSVQDVIGGTKVYLLRPGSHLLRKYGAVRPWGELMSEGPGMSLIVFFV